MERAVREQTLGKGGLVVVGSIPCVDGPLRDAVVGEVAFAGVAVGGARPGVFGALAVPGLG